MDLLSLAVGALSVAAVGLALWLAADEGWREALFDEPFGDIPELPEEMAATREISGVGAAAGSGQTVHTTHHGSHSRNGGGNSR